MTFNMQEEKPRSDAAMESIIEGKKMEAYAEHRTKDMHACAFCGNIGYRKRPMRQVGAKWICIDCLRSLKETLEGLDQWEAEIQLEKEMSKKIDETLRT